MEKHLSRAFVFVLVVILLSIGLILVPSVVLITVAPIVGSGHSSQDRCIAHEGPLVKFRPITSGEEPNSTTTWVPGHEGDEFWKSLIPLANSGFVTVKQPDGNLTGYGLSVYHQLHCLLALREALFPDMPMGQGLSGSSKHKGPHHSHDAWHMHHCFDYLAQAIICSADDTFEPAHTSINHLGFEVASVSGMGQVHRCRDQKSLWATVLRTQQNPLSSKTWEDGEGVRSWLSRTDDKGRFK